MWWYDVLGSVARSLIIYLGMVFLHLPVKIVEVLIIWRSLSGKSEFVWVRKVSSSCRVRRWTWLVSVVMIVWILQLFSCIFAGSMVDERESHRLGAGPLSWGFVDVTWAWVSVPDCPFSVFILWQRATLFQADIISAVWGLLAGKCPIVVRSKCQRKDWSRDHGPSCADGRPRQANVPAKGWCVDMRFEKLGIIMPVVSYNVYMRLVG